MSASKVFTRFDIYNRYLGGSTLLWNLSADFIRFAPQPFTFTVRASRSGAGDWVEIGIITDGYNYFVDPNRWIWAKDIRIHYMVDITTGDGKSYSSEVKQALGTLNFQQKLNAAAITRKEAMLLHLKVGTQGQLWKRRHWGTKCPRCVDFDTNEPAGSHCTVCYNTGFVGGYFNPLEMYMHLKADSGRRKTNEEPTQTTQNQSKIGRALACPWLDTNDVWVNCQNDQHFYIQKVTPIEYMGVPLLFDPIDLRLAQSSDIVYTLTVAPESSSSA